MINANELRIGNWVDAISSKGPFVVTHIRKQFVKDGEIYFVNSFLPEHLLPIPLTPEILEACGFEKVILENKYFNSEIGFLEEGFQGFTMPDSDGNNSLAYELTSLHQLQNLFYALCGQELQYSPASK